MRHAMQIALGLGCLAATTAAAAATPPKCRDCTKTITRDVVVVGGGAAGAHAAVWLRDHGHSVVVVEKADHLGGHTDSYKDPVTGKAINVGVQGWMEYKSAFDFPKRMNVSIDGSMEMYPNVPRYIDYRTGKDLPNYVDPAAPAMIAAMQRYLDVLLKYEDMVLPGFFNFPDPAKAKIPEDLLMPFHQFVEKYDLADAVPMIWDATAQGLGDTMNVPSIWVMQASGAPFVRAMLGLVSSVVPPSGRLYDLYENVGKFLGGDVLYSSTVVSATRYDERNAKNGVSLRVKGVGKVKGADKVTCINAKRLLIAMEPTPENMAPFALDKDEAGVLGKFKYATVYAGVIQHPSLQPLNAYTARSPESYNHTVFPVAPLIAHLDHIGGTVDLFQFTAVGTQHDTPESMKSLLAKSINTLIKGGTLPAAAADASIHYSAFANHGKMHAHVTADELRAGFMQRLNGLQGRRHTFYTGAAFSAGFSTVLWEYNTVLLPKLVQGL